MQDICCTQVSAAETATLSGLLHGRLPVDEHAERDETGSGSRRTRNRWPSGLTSNTEMSRSSVNTAVGGSLARVSPA